MVFSPSVLRVYLAAAAVIAALLGARPQYQVDWSSDVVLMAGMSDLLVIVLLVLFYTLTSKLVRVGLLVERLNRFLHWGLALGIIVFAGLAQALFLKTGETLNLDILVFFLHRSHELAEIAAGAMDHELLWVLLICVSLPLLANMRFSHGVLAGMHGLMFAVPIGLIPAGYVLFPDTSNDGKLDIVLPEHSQKTLYRGQYAALTDYQLGWNLVSPMRWQRGILTGLSLGSSLGIAQYQAIAKNEAAQLLYVRPHTALPPEKPINILFLLLESMRHDALGAYGDGTGAPSNTPFLDELVRGGWQVERAYTTIPHTSKALVGIYCGTFPRFETNILEALPDNLPLTCLPHLLTSAGYSTAHFQTAPASFEARDQFLRNVGFGSQFTQESITENAWAQLGYLGVDDRAMIAPALDWMKQQAVAGKPFFASLLTIATHHPYVSPGHIVPVHDAAQAKLGYLKAVRYTDAMLRELFAEMRKQGLLDNTLVVITGDHGEAFAEHGQIAHNGSSYEEGIRVPLILHGPMLGEPRMIAGLRQHTDIMPTVLDIAGIKYSGVLPGKSLSTDFAGHTDLITACFYQDYCLNHLSADGKKVLFFYGKRALQMYDLNVDPKETNSLLSESRQEDAKERLHVAARIKKSFEVVYRPVSREMINQ